MRKLLLDNPLAKEIHSIITIEDFLEAMASKEMSAWFFRRLIGRTRTFIWEGQPIGVRNLLMESELVDSLSQAERVMRGNGVTINEKKIQKKEISREDFVDGDWLWLGVGKSDRHLIIYAENVLDESIVKELRPTTLDTRPSKSDHNTHRNTQRVEPRAHS